MCEYVENVSYTVVSSDIIDSVMDILSSSEDIFGFDVETDFDGKIKFLQVYSPSKGTTFIFYGDSTEAEKLSTLFESMRVVGHNIQFDLTACLFNYNKYPVPVVDTFMLACSLQEDQKGLKPLCNQYFGFNVVSWESLFEHYDYDNMTDEKWHYIANDPYYSYILYQHYKKAGLFDFIKRIHDIDLSAMLRYMKASVTGLLVDKDRFKTYFEKYTNQVSELQEKLDLYAGWEVRTSSTKDLKKLLFEQLELPIPPIKTDKGDISVSKEALSYVPDKDGIVSLISEIKEAKSILTSIKGIGDMDILHPEYRMVGFDGTSRVYSTNPSLSQIPKVLRYSFVPHDGKKFLYLDLKSAECYILVKWAKCKKLIDAYESGDDLYTVIAKDVFNKDNIDVEEREKIKGVVLSILYGSDGSSVARSMRITEEEAKILIDRFMSLYPEISEFQDKAYKYTVKNGFIQSFYFRPRVLKEDKDNEDATRKRQSINTAIQNTCADCLKLCVGKNDLKSSVKFVTTVFDSILFEVPSEWERTDASEFLSDFFLSCKPFLFRYTFAFGDTWGNAFDSL